MKTKVSIKFRLQDWNTRMSSNEERKFLALYLLEKIEPRFPLGIKIHRTPEGEIFHKVLFDSNIGRIDDGRWMVFITNRIGNVYGFRMGEDFLRVKNRVTVAKKFMEVAGWLNERGLS